MLLSQCRAAIIEKMRYGRIHFILAFLLLAATTEGFSFEISCQNCSGQVEVDVNQTLYLEKRGDHGPFVVFEAGSGNTVETWNKIIPSISQIGQTITYDRLGIGKSASSGEQESLYLAPQVIQRLRSALAQLSVPKPYILVGHSLGGIYMQYFARKYPSEIAAVVLVDSSTPNEPRVNSPFKNKSKTSKEWKIAYAKNLDILAQLPPFPKIPLVVLTAAHHGENFQENLWRSLQRDIANSSPYGSQIIALQSDHFIQLDEPSVVIDAIRVLVTKK